MEKQAVMKELEENNYTEVLDLIEDAEKGKLEELELAKSLGLLRDEQLNKAVIQILKDEGVHVYFVDENTPFDKE
ncbi:hypothetical protein [Alteribacter populi]|uniref:hypothetical protein n=1 Tax=Alteribacter populi TaxID=2011011 RepID=UPI000BBACF11|nr:hypothetical protein [Alteribacter populi]